jgi:N-acetylneuraminic acid mutarotase
LELSCPRFVHQEELMSRPPSLHLVLSLSVLALAACGESPSPTQPETAGDLAPPAPLLALASNTWTAKAPMPGYRSGVSAGVAPDSAGRSIVYVFGGQDDQGGTKWNIQAYDVATNTWTGKAQTTYRTRLNGVGRIGSRLYFSGGFQFHDEGDPYSAELYAYDPAGDRLTRKRDMPKYTADGVTGVIDGKLYVIPGTCSGEGWPYPGHCEVERIRELYRYNPATNAWTKLARCPHFHRSGTGGVINGKFYVVGGFNNFDGLAYLNVYDPATNTWRTRAPLPTAGRVIGAVLQNKLFVVAGSGTGRRAYSYDPGTNTWKTRAAPQWDHDALVRVTLGGRSHLLAVGGYQGWPFEINDSELYTP